MKIVTCTNVPYTPSLFFFSFSSRFIVLSCIGLAWPGLVWLLSTDSLLYSLSQFWRKISLSPLMMLLLLLFCIGATKDDEHHDDDNVDMAGSTPSLLPFHFHHCDCDWHTFSRAALPFPPFLLLSSSLCFFFLAFRSLSLSFPLMSIYTCVPVVLSKKGASVVYLLHITYTRIFQCPIASTKIYKKNLVCWKLPMFCIAYHFIAQDILPGIHTMLMYRPSPIYFPNSLHERETRRNRSIFLVQLVYFVYFPEKKFPQI